MGDALFVLELVIALTGLPILETILLLPVLVVVAPPLLRLMITESVGAGSCSWFLIGFVLLVVLWTRLLVLPPVCLVVLCVPPPVLAAVQLLLGNAPYCGGGDGSACGMGTILSSGGVDIFNL